VVVLEESLWPPSWIQLPPEALAERARPVARAAAAVTTKAWEAVMSVHLEEWINLKDRPV
jgi:hypothetical protein